MNIVAWACSEEEFGRRVKQAATDIDCILLELEYIQLLDQRIEDPESADELIDMRATAQRQPGDTVFGTFHTWVQSDEN